MAVINILGFFLPDDFVIFYFTVLYQLQKLQNTEIKKNT